MNLFFFCTGAKGVATLWNVLLVISQKTNLQLSSKAARGRFFSPPFSHVTFRNKRTKKKISCLRK